jgi:hypothetical protein
MPVDASIIGGLRPVQFENPTNALAKILQVQEAQQGQQMNRMKMDEYQRGITEQNALADLYKGAYSPDGKLDRNALVSGAASRGLGAKIPGLQKGFADQDKATAETEKAQLEKHLKTFEVTGQIMSGVRDQATWELAKQQTAQLLGADVAARLPAVYDPAAVQANMQQAMSVKDQMEQRHKALTFGETQRHNQATETISVDNNKRSVNASLANAGATREVASATRDAARIKGDRDTEMKLGDDYRKQSKNFQDVGEAYRLINSTLDKASTSPAATLASATKFMKLLDPGSVVRESELGMALAATGVFDRATNYYQTLLRGKVLTPQQVADFKNITKQIYGAAQAGQKQIDASYTKQAQTYGLRPEMVVQDLGQNETAAPAQPSGLPKGWSVKGQ